jgi:hypothetical protein
MKPTPIHYAGGVTYNTARGSVVDMLGGWPVCCSGDRARRIRAQGQQTYERAAVTCRGCLDRIRRHDERAARLRAAAEEGSERR